MKLNKTSRLTLIISAYVVAAPMLLMTYRAMMEILYIQNILYSPLFVFSVVVSLIAGVLSLGFVYYIISMPAKVQKISSLTVWMLSCLAIPAVIVAAWLAIAVLQDLVGVACNNPIEGTGSCTEIPLFDIAILVAYPFMPLLTAVVSYVGIISIKKDLSTGSGKKKRSTKKR